MGPQITHMEHKVSEDTQEESVHCSLPFLPLSYQSFYLLAMPSSQSLRHEHSHVTGHLGDSFIPFRECDIHNKQRWDLLFK